MNLFYQLEYCVRAIVEVEWLARLARERDVLSLNPATLPFSDNLQF